jgi:hypothetical protein
MQSGLAWIVRCIVSGVLLASMTGTSAVAIMGAGEREQASPSDEYGRQGGVRAGGWQAVIDHDQSDRGTPWTRRQPWLRSPRLATATSAEQYDRALPQPHHREH